MPICLHPFRLRVTLAMYSAVAVLVLLLPAEQAAAGTHIVDARDGPLRLAGGPQLRSRQRPGQHQRLPETADERRKLLLSLYGYLSEAENPSQAEPLVTTIQRLWSISESPTTDLLMARATQAIETGNLKSALTFLNAVTRIQPDFAEGWNRRAYVFYQRSAPDRALGDLRKVLALDPNHFQALESVGSILRTMGENKAALEAYRKLKAMHPQATGVDKSIDELAREVEGEPI